MQLWSIQRSPLLQDQAGRGVGSREMGPYPHPSSPSGSTTGGARVPLDWSRVCRLPGLSSWWRTRPCRFHCAACWKLRGVGVRLVHWAEEFCLEHLQDHHGVKRWGRLSSRWIGSSSESWSRPSRLWRVGSLCLPEMHESAEQREIWIPCDGSSNSKGFVSRRAKILSLKEKNSEVPWQRTAQTNGHAVTLRC